MQPFCTKVVPGRAVVGAVPKSTQRRVVLRPPLLEAAGVDLHAAIGLLQPVCVHGQPLVEVVFSREVSHSEA